MVRSVCSGGAPRGPRPGRRRIGTGSLASGSPSHSGADAELTPPWPVTRDELDLWTKLVRELDRIGAVAQLDAPAIASLVSGLVLERRTVTRLLSGDEPIVLHSEKGGSYMNPLAAYYLSLRKSNLASMAEAGLTRSRRDGVTDDRSVIASLEAERLTHVHEKIRLMLGGGKATDEPKRPEEVRVQDPRTLPEGDTGL